MKPLFDVNSAVFPINGLKYALIVYDKFRSSFILACVRRLILISGSDNIAGGDEKTFEVSGDGR